MAVPVAVIISVRSKGVVVACNSGVAVSGTRVDVEVGEGVSVGDGEWVGSSAITTSLLVSVDKFKAMASQVEVSSRPAGDCSLEAEFTLNID